MHTIVNMAIYSTIFCVQYIHICVLHACPIRELHCRITRIGLSASLSERQSFAPGPSSRSGALVVMAS